MATPFLPGVFVLPARDDRGVAKRAREADLLVLSEEADTRGWSSAVPERTLALRRRRGPASSSSPRDCGWVAVAAARVDEDGFHCDEEGTPDAVGAGIAGKKSALVDATSCVACSCNVDLAAFDPPPMAVPLLPLSCFIADLCGDSNILKNRVTKRARDGDLLPLSEESDARGWSSAVPERSLALRHRRGPYVRSSRRGCGWVAAAGDELTRRSEESPTADAGRCTTDEISPTLA